MNLSLFWKQVKRVSWIGLICWVGCNSEASSNHAASAQAIPISIVADSQRYTIPYDLTQADDTFRLPDKLIEVSALSYADAGQLALVQDEMGVIFLLDVGTGEIVKEYSFGKSGDYEGIEVVDGTAYVLKSSGKITEIADILSDSPRMSHEYNNALSSDDDTEGLGYDPVKKELLIACKEPYETSEREIKTQRAIYGYNMETHQLGDHPRCLINLLELSKFLQTYHKDEAWIQSFNPEKKGSFKPSGIAVHPETGYLFIIASVGKMLIVLNRSYQIVAAQALDEDLFAQPEGICFSPDGTLYISNEGKTGSGNVLRFSVSSE